MKNKLSITNVIQYLSAKLLAYDNDIYLNDKFIIIELPHSYNLKKIMEKLILSIKKDNNIIKIVNSKTNYTVLELTINNNIYLVKIFRSDLDF